MKKIIEHFTPYGHVYAQCLMELEEGGFAVGIQLEGYVRDYFETLEEAELFYQEKIQEY